MPKPIFGDNGSACILTKASGRGDRNLFWDSPTGWDGVAGILRLGWGRVNCYVPPDGVSASEVFAIDCTKINKLQFCVFEHHQ
jgi:hypothetical protein